MKLIRPSYEILTEVDGNKILQNIEKAGRICYKSDNLREWRHILRLRTSQAAHPQMREIMKPLLKDLQSKIPVIFDDIGEK